MRCSRPMTSCGSAKGSLMSCERPRTLAKRKAQSWKLSARSEPRGRTGRPSDEKRRLAGVPLGGDTPPRGDASPAHGSLCACAIRSSEPSVPTSCGGRMDLSSRSHEAVSSSMQRITARWRASSLRPRHMSRPCDQWCSKPMIFAKRSISAMRASSSTTKSSRPGTCRCVDEWSCSCQNESTCCCASSTTARESATAAGPRKVVGRWVRRYAKKMCHAASSETYSKGKCSQRFGPPAGSSYSLQ
mmetsp:Transcript_20255/g.57975  ORF Transcript_20255/g.57975 Transcript_20255/m.57975 type:complete len:244 (-) Transcript_20255:121-852(-)